MPVNPMIYSRLAFIRYLHGLGITQAQLPEPMSYATLLMVHDAVESLLLLVADHYGVSASKFDDYWKVLNPKVPGGLTEHRGMQRLNRSRNDLKHNGVNPSATTINLALSDTATFMAATTQAVFGVDYSAVSMADLVSQERVRDRLRDAEVAESAGDRVKAMIAIRDAYELLFAPHENPHYLNGSPFAFGEDMRWAWHGERHFADGMKVACHTDNVNRVGKLHDVADLLGKSVGATVAMREAVRMLALGIEFPVYLRFNRLTPVTGSTYAKRYYRAPKGYAPTSEEVQSCVEFVVTAALKLAAAEAQQTDPEWLSRGVNGRVEWETIAEVDADHTVYRP